MTDPAYQAVYNQILSSIQQALTNSAVVTLYGRDFIDVPPEAEAIKGLKLRLDPGRLELRRVCPPAQAAFAWTAEITIDDDGDYTHFLLLQDGRIVEAYGRNLTELDLAHSQALAERILALLKQAQQAGQN